MVDFQSSPPIDEQKPPQFPSLAGYRVNEVNELETIIDPRTSTVTLINPPVEKERELVGSSLGCHVLGAAPLKPDLKSVNNVFAAAQHRILRKPIEPNRRLLRQMKRFIKRNFSKHFDCATPDDYLSFEKWIETTNYSQARKEELKKIRVDLQDKNSKKHKELKSFLKDESYSEFKNPRTINSRTDSLKVLFGPIAKVIENITYRNPAFIKHIPVPDRPQYILDMFGHITELLEGDYVCYEASFSKVLMESIELVHYRKVLGPILHMFEDYGLFEETKTSFSKLIFKLLVVTMTSIRFSGEMDTSVGNGCSNFWTFHFIAHLSNVKVIGMVIEGDDNLSSIIGKYNERLAEALGFRLKLKTHQRIQDSSFCGMIFDPEAKQIIADPIKQILNLGWTNRQYAEASSAKRRTLLRAKGFSMLYQYAGCPILFKLGLRILKNTSGCDISGLLQKTKDSYEKRMLQESYNYVLANINYKGEIPGPHLNTRILFEERFKITVEMQLICENIIDNWSGGPLDLPLPWPNSNVKMFYDYFCPVYDHVNNLPISLYGKDPLLRGYG